MGRSSDIFDWENADYYTLLAVERYADISVIRKGYRKLAKLHHPDRYPLDSAERLSAAERFKALTHAHDVLTDPDAKAAYDEQLSLNERIQFGQYQIVIPPKPDPTPADAAQTPPAKRRRHDDDDDDWDDPADSEPTFGEHLGHAQDGGRRGGVSEASKRSAANAYYAQGIRYYGYGEFDRAMRCFMAAMQLDPSRKVPGHVWSRLVRYSYGWD